jgi:phosphoesterase RecJ-like protein
MNLANEIVQSIQEAEKIVITSHRSPDGDSIGSSLGMLRFIRSIGKEAIVCHPDACPSFLEWLKDGDEIVTFEREQDRVIALMDDADLIFVWITMGRTAWEKKWEEYFSLLMERRS